MERNSLQRNSMGNNPTPRLKVVGFHVEGASSSPASNLLQDAVQGSNNDSPNPVIIPPSFQVQPILKQAAGGGYVCTSMAWHAA